jgi:alpha-galactosidase
MKDVTYTCAGINHQAFFLEYKVNGIDAYPRIFAAAEDQARYREEAVRIEMMKALGYFVTESSGHNSEYNAWFRKRQDLIDRYVPDSYASSVRIINERTATRDEEMEKILAQEKISLARGNEYASCILNALIGDGTMFEFNGNVPNTGAGLISNLPDGAIVEVPIAASKHGMRAAHIGNLPRHLAALNTVNAQCELLAVDGLMNGDRDAIFHAILNDPLTAAVCSLAEIRAMTDEMFEANREELPMFR